MQTIESIANHELFNYRMMIKIYYASKKILP